MLTVAAHIACTTRRKCLRFAKSTFPLDWLYGSMDVLVASATLLRL